MHAEFWCGNLNERDLGIDGRIILKCTLKKRDVRAWTGLVWLRARRNG
jgi:hypothetical protein